MSEYGDSVADGRDDPFDSERRGYSRRQVDEYIAMRNGHVRQLETRLSQGHAEIERLHRELAEAHEASTRPAHEEIPERVGQILKLAADQATADLKKVSAEIADMRDVAKNETDQLRADTKRETDQALAQAQDQAERMFVAAKDEADRAVAAAKAEAEHMLSTAQATAERTVADANKHAESTVAAAMAQAKQQVDEATARATAIHDGAERRLNLLISRHTETVRRLTEIRDVVTSLVAGETARGSLDDEVARALGQHTASHGGADGRGQGQHDPLAVGAHRAGRPVPAGRTAVASRPAPRDLDRPDPLAASRPDPLAGTRPDPLTADRPDPLSTDRTERRSDGVHHALEPDTVLGGADGGPQSEDDPRDNTDDLTEAADNVRHSSAMNVLAGSPRGSDLVLDEAGGLGIDG
jgi:cell division septum initiation protein DivIVA